MKLICPKCETEIEVEDDGMPEKRRPVRCTSCGESWFAGGKTDLYALSFAKQNKIDPEVVRILKEEAALEISARKADEAERLAAKTTGGNKKENQVSETISKQISPDGYVSLTSRQRGFVLLLGLLAGLTALYVFAPNVVKRFPNSSDFVFSYVFFINDIRQSISEFIQTSQKFLVSLDITGTVTKIKEWLQNSLQTITEFGLGLFRTQEAGTGS